MKAVAFDKTGTLTTGSLSVSDFFVFSFLPDGSYEVEENSIFHSASSQLLCPDGSRISWKLIFQYILTTERASSHPLSKSIVKFCQDKLFAWKIPLDAVRDSDMQTFVPGKGIKARFGKHVLLIGSIELLSTK